MMEEDLGAMVRRLALTEEESQEIVLPNNSESWKPRRFLLVGRLLTNNPYRKEALMGTMKSLWSPKKKGRDQPRVTAIALDGSDRIVFSFSHEYDRNRVLQGCPCTLIRHSSLSRRLTEGRTC